jgi:hypothetical protein
MEKMSPNRGFLALGSGNNSSFTAYIMNIWLRASFLLAKSDLEEVYISD